LAEQDYTFTTSSDLKGAGRFYLHYETKALTTEELLAQLYTVYTTVSPKEIMIKGSLNSDASCFI
jgi:hypothetical protein